MAYQSVWFDTNIPTDIIKIIERDLSIDYDEHLQLSKLSGNWESTVKRNSSNTWIPSQHWVAGFIWHYVNKGNNENFMYDLTNIDCESMQYTVYEEGQYYKWHNDASLPQVTCVGPTNTSDKEKQKNDYLVKHTDKLRKLSFVVQLSSADDYEGGNLQIMDENGESYFAPRKQGTIILFDSRAQHRVTKVTKGTRKSIVGWVVGPRWR